MQSETVTLFPTCQSTSILRTWPPRPRCHLECGQCSVSFGGGRGSEATQLAIPFSACHRPATGRHWHSVCTPSRATHSREHGLYLWLCCFPKGIMAALRPLLNPRSSRRGPKSTSGTRLATMSKLSRTGRSPKALTTRCARGSGPDTDAQQWLLGQQEDKAQAAQWLLEVLEVHHIKELEVLLMCNKSCCAEIAHNVSSKNCKALREMAAQLSIWVTNPNARLLRKENEQPAGCKLYICAQVKPWNHPAKKSRGGTKNKQKKRTSHNFNKRWILI